MKEKKQGYLKIDIVVELNAIFNTLRNIKDRNVEKAL